MAKKGNRVQVILECTEHKATGQPGMSRYITTKNKKNTTERLEMKKFNPVLRKVTVHKEINSICVVRSTFYVIRLTSDISKNVKLITYNLQHKKRWQRK